MARAPPTPSSGDEEDYSPSATVIHFDHPLPLLRSPIAAAAIDDPSSGPFLLAFENPRSFHSAFAASNSKLIEQCNAGAGIGCAINATNKCKPPWWRLMRGGGGTMDLKQREECEVREMANCVAAAKEKCVDFAKDKCLPCFRIARVALDDRNAAKRASKLVLCASMVDQDWERWNLVGIGRLRKWVWDDSGVAVTNYRGSVLLDSVVVL